MMFPFNLHVGSIVINLHFIFEVLAYSLGFQYYLFLKRHTQEKLSFETRMWIIVIAAAGALIGSRVVGYYSSPHVSQESLEMWVIRIMSSKSILGGLIGGIFSVEIAKKFMGIKYSTGDLFVYPIILGMMVGRIGCFSQGVFDGTHGIPSNLPWAMDMGDGVLRHPAQLYEIIFLGALWGILKGIDFRLEDGARFKIFIITYALFRFFIEWIKPAYFAFYGFSAVQVACVVGIIYYVPVFIRPQTLFKR